MACRQHESNRGCYSGFFPVYVRIMKTRASQALASEWIAGTVAGLPGWDLYVFRCPQLRSRDMPSDLVGAVVQAIEQQQSAAFGSEIPPVVQTIEPTRGNPDASKRFSVIGDPGHDSLIKARYASTILRVAQTVDQQTAARLVSGLSRDFPCPTERAEIAELHFRAINSFSELATALYSDTASKREHLWKSAMDTAAAWLNAVIRL
jgi:hypothetical protein